MGPYEDPHGTHASHAETSSLGSAAEIRKTAQTEETLLIDNEPDDANNCPMLWYLNRYRVLLISILSRVYFGPHNADYEHSYSIIHFFFHSKYPSSTLNNPLIKSHVGFPSWGVMCYGSQSTLFYLDYDREM